MTITVQITRPDRSAREILVDVMTEVSRRRALTDEESKVLESLIKGETDPARQYRWTPERDARLLRLNRSGFTAPAIGRKMDCTAQSVRDRLKVLRRTCPDLPKGRIGLVQGRGE